MTTCPAWATFIVFNLTVFMALVSFLIFYIIDEIKSLDMTDILNVECPEYDEREEQEK